MWQTLEFSAIYAGIAIQERLFSRLVRFLDQLVGYDEMLQDRAQSEDTVGQVHKFTENFRFDFGTDQTLFDFFEF